MTKSDMERITIFDLFIFIVLFPFYIIGRLIFKIGNIKLFSISNPVSDNEKGEQKQEWFNEEPK